jgi:hypothetical protein
VCVCVCVCEREREREEGKPKANSMELIKHIARSPESHLEMCLQFSNVGSFFFLFLRGGKAKLYWRGYSWLSVVVSPETIEHFYVPLILAAFTGVEL